MKKITFFLLLMFSSLSFSQNLVVNGDFQTGLKAPWYGVAANVVDLDPNLGGAFFNQANVTAVGPAYNVNLSQEIPLVDGKTYLLTFDAFTDADTNSRTMIVGLGQTADPYGSLTSTPTLTATLQSFSYQYTINYGDAVPDRVIFDMGAALGYVFIDNVSVVEVVNTCNNGIKDGDETDVDCGGYCPVCVATPTVAAQTPPARPVGDVVSIYSDAYTSLSVNEWGPNWGPYSARINDFPILGNPTKVVNIASGKTFAGIDFYPSTFDATTFTTFHLDYWIADPLPVGQVLSIKLSNHVGGTAVETSAIEYLPNPLLTNQWVALDIPLSSFVGASAPPNLSRNAIAQIILTAARADGNVPLNIYVDNIYFHKNTTMGVSSFEASKFKMYPNPTNDILNISSDSTIETIKIYNTLGQIVANKNYSSNLESVNVSHLSKGVYMVSVQVGSEIVSKQFIKN
ncbi:MAG: T9SS type A sorting domain-containing protein [Flavobacterium sp.]|nr:T9SS type A sorting domain-containing protein [Flavobacterium sp.]